jgi:hypothetical protein
LGFFPRLGILCFNEAAAVDDVVRRALGALVNAFLVGMLAQSNSVTAFAEALAAIADYVVSLDSQSKSPCSLPFRFFFAFPMG